MCSASVLAVISTTYACKGLVDEFCLEAKRDKAARAECILWTMGANFWEWSNGMRIFFWRWPEAH